MMIKQDPMREPNSSMTYQIRIKGHLDAKWADWFEGLTITLEDTGETILTGVIVDQSSLYSLLKKIHNLGMMLISVNQVELN
jgi:hypothetical protein